MAGISPLMVLVLILSRSLCFFALALANIIESFKTINLCFLHMARDSFNFFIFLSVWRNRLFTFPVETFCVPSEDFPLTVDALLLRFTRMINIFSFKSDAQLEHGPGLSRIYTHCLLLMVPCIAEVFALPSYSGTEYHTLFP